jgi:hypothetical protein
MSIRLLTNQLQRETADNRRLDVSAGHPPAAQDANSPTRERQTPFMVGGGERSGSTRTHLSPAPNPSPPSQIKIALKEPKPGTGYEIPGGIAARFGRNSLKESGLIPEQVGSAPSPPVPISQEESAPVESLVAGEETDDIQVQEQERATEQGEAARITIELKSH